MMSPFKKTVFFFLLFSAFNLYGQKIIHGTISDVQTGETLPAANIQIEGTFRGTISNDNGEYILKLEKLPATLKASYIGYATQTVIVTLGSGPEQNIFLQPIVYRMAPIIVTGEDPAVKIMRKVIERKKVWRAKLKTYQANAYTRVVLENDTSVTSIMESISETFWDKKKGVREIIKSKRQTSNIQQQDNFVNVSLVTNLYDDNIEIAGFKLIGVTNPTALDHYNFKLTGERKQDDKTVFDISVQPKSKLETAFVGQIAVLDQDFALIEVNLKPGESVMFPPPVQKFEFRYHQQFSNFGSEFWLPIDVRTEGVLKFGMALLQFPAIKFNRISRLSNYQINATLPDSIFQKKKIWMVDSTTMVKDPDSVFTENPDVVPFSREETRAYLELDSTMTLQKAYKPTGPLARFVKLEVENENNANDRERKSSGKFLAGIEPLIGFNRVDALHLGLKKSFYFQRNFQLEFQGGFNTGSQKWFYGSAIKVGLGKKLPTQFRISYLQSSASRFSSPSYPPLISSSQMLLGWDDYFDYYWSGKLRFELNRSFKFLRSKIAAGLNLEKHSSLEKATDYNLLGKDIIQRPNPAIPEGRLNSLDLKLILGDAYIPFGIVGQKRLEIYLEHSPGKFLDNDFDFTRLTLSADYRLNTLFRRRLLPNTLDLHLIAGISSENLPPQRFGSIDGSLKTFTPFGVIRSLSGRPYEGKDYLAIFGEYNFRTVPFELIGWRWAARNNLGIIIHGAWGRTWNTPQIAAKWNYLPNSLPAAHYETGFSLTGLFNLFRLDTIYRLDRPGLYLGFGMTRFF